jgi:hypothetical protein
MPSIRNELERGADMTRVVMDAPLAAARACIDAYEAGIRIATDAQLTVARTVRLEPIRSVAATCANLTRDIGATQLSAARWFLDA